MNKEEVQVMIDAAMTKHNRNATLISMALGFALLALFMEGLFRILGVIPPFLGIDISIVPR
jgi:preprotein translocase subunit SecD